MSCSWWLQDVMLNPSRQCDNNNNNNNYGDFDTCGVKTSCFQPAAFLPAKHQTRLTNNTADTREELLLLLHSPVECVPDQKKTGKKIDLTK